MQLPLRRARVELVMCSPQEQQRTITATATTAAEAAAAAEADAVANGRATSSANVQLLFRNVSTKRSKGTKCELGTIL